MNTGRGRHRQTTLLNQPPTLNAGVSRPSLLHEILQKILPQLLLPVFREFPATHPIHDENLLNPTPRVQPVVVEVELVCVTTDCGPGHHLLEDSRKPVGPFRYNVDDFLVGGDGEVGGGLTSILQTADVKPLFTPRTETISLSVQMRDVILTAGGTGSFFWSKEPDLTVHARGVDDGVIENSEV